MDLLLIRHTKPEVADGTCYGHLDLDLAASYVHEKEHLVRRLSLIDSKWKERTPITSPLQRCRKLASDIFGEVSTDNRLRELHFGDWEGKLWDELGSENYRAWLEDFVNVRPPEGETYAELFQRAVDFLISHKQADRPLIVFTHAGFIRCVLARCMGLPKEYVFRLKLDYGSINHVTIQNESPSVRFVNR